MLICDVARETLGTQLFIHFFTCLCRDIPKENDTPRFFSPRQGFKNFFDRAIRSAHLAQKVEFFDGMCGSDSSIEKFGSKRHFFDCVRMPDLVCDRKSPFRSTDPTSEELALGFYQMQKRLNKT